MDPYDSHHASGPDRSPESPTPIYDRLLAEWQEAARRDAGPGPVDASPGPQVTRGSGRGRKGAFVPAARAEEGRG
ncbi:hypothetical protein AB0P41_06985 [Streptomyces sp. NPDC079167]|uniref:hypothetical protein n=1 Tax=Streptomyces sp. NPDC079167 TaxID=3154513 RepID=UPI00341AC2CD